LLSFFKFNSQKTKGIGLLLLTLYFGGALVSFSSKDASFNRASSNEISNIWGVAGSYIADPIMQFIGFASFVAVFAFAVWAYRVLCKKPYGSLALKSGLLLVATLAFSAAISSIESPEKWPFYVGIGGLAGDLIRELSLKFMPLYAFVAGAIFTFLASFYFALGTNIAELKYVYSIIKRSVVFTKRMVVMLSIFAANIYRKFKKKEPIEQLKPLPKAPKRKPVELPEDIVEYQKPESKKAARQTALKLDFNEFQLPDFDFLTEAKPTGKSNINQKALEQNAKLLKKVLEDFGVKGEILKVRPGPVVTLYELEPAAGTKSSRVIGLADDIARSMSSISARISVIPGRNLLGIELPNAERETVYLRELMETEEYRDERIKLPIALGKDIGGSPVMADLARMPHLLIAGTTGSGKSVAVNAMILSYLYRLTPDECKFIMIDPKMLELSVYDGIPHLLAPVVTEPKKAIVALKWAVREMEDRYRLMSTLGVRNISGYNKRIEDAVKSGEVLERTVQTGFNSETGEPIFEKQPLAMNNLPLIVVIVDEMADLMLTAGKEIESSIQRLAQMARAAGIHMVMATQRPSVDVITGVIKANFPTRISFQVTSRIDSRTILGEMGAEQLLGMGDMLYMSGGGRITRVHGPFVDDKEVEKVVNHLKAQGSPFYIEDVTKDDEEGFEDVMGEGSGDDLYDKAVAIVLRDKKASTSYIQRQLRIGYNRAANLIERMEKEGLISEPGHTGKREVIEA
jgi:S-DNA-T family DNA segregation ATPase FtsK/SpoIIIE